MATNWLGGDGEPAEPTRYRLLRGVNLIGHGGPGGGYLLSTGTEPVNVPTEADQLSQLIHNRRRLVTIDVTLVA